MCGINTSINISKCIPNEPIIKKVDNNINKAIIKEKVFIQCQDSNQTSNFNYTNKSNPISFVDNSSKDQELIILKEKIANGYQPTKSEMAIINGVNIKPVQKDYNTTLEKPKNKISESDANFIKDLEKKVKNGYTPSNQEVNKFNNIISPEKKDDKIKTQIEKHTPKLENRVKNHYNYYPETKPLIEESEEKNKGKASSVIKHAIVGAVIGHVLFDDPDSAENAVRGAAIGGLYGYFKKK